MTDEQLKEWILSELSIERNLHVVCRRLGVPIERVKEFSEQDEVFHRRLSLLFLEMPFPPNASSQEIKEKVLQALREGRNVGVMMDEYGLTHPQMAALMVENYPLLKRPRTERD